MSEVPSRGHRRGRNTPHRGRGGRFFSRGTQRGSCGRPDAQHGRGSKSGAHSRGLTRGGKVDRNENGERFGLSHYQDSSRGWQGGTSNRARVHTSNRKTDRNESDNESEGSHDSRHNVQRGSWREQGWQGGISRDKGRGGGASRRGKRKSNDSNAEPHLDHDSLLLMLKKDPDELVMDITSDRYLPAFESLLNQFDLPDKDVIVILRVFAQACDSETSRAFLIILLNKLVNSVYLGSALTRYINCLAYASRNEERDIEEELKCMVKVFIEILKKLPTSLPHLPLPNLLHAATALLDNGQIRNTEIKPSVENLIALRDQMAEKVQKKEETKKTKRRIDPGDEAALLDNEDPPDNFRCLSVIPQQDDIHPKGPVFFRRNKVKGSYDGPEHYLDVQFRLLREDFIRPLREGIAALSESTGTSATKPSQDIRVYNGVKLLKPLCSSKGVTYEIIFDVSRLKRIRWENSKRLIYGSLLCLSKDNFETFVLATVGERNPRLLEQGIFQVRFTDINADLGNATYQMVETLAYFEACRHVLEGLQEISCFHFPFERYIVKSEPDVQAPLYLRNTSKEVIYDLTCMMRSPESKTSARSEVGYYNRQKGRSVNILDLNSWPSAEDLELDSSQLKAVQMALTKEFAIIQGPPGTGKTYIGLKVANVLLNNKVYWNTNDLRNDKRLGLHDKPRFFSHPILLVCYTNHALDQFLEGIYKFHPEGIVRVGGQSQSCMLEECNIRSIKEKIRQYHRERCQYYRRLGRLRRQRRQQWYYDYYDSDDEVDEGELVFPEISEELEEIYHSQDWIRPKLTDLYDELKELSSELEGIYDEIHKLKTTVMDEKELLSKCTVFENKYDSIVSRFKDENGKNIKVKPNVMHYWLGLLTNTLDFIESGSTFVKPVATYLLSRAERINAVNSTDELVFHKVKQAKGVDGDFNDFYAILNGEDSYILIPNMESSSIDTRYSMTILLYVYLETSPGPIVTFHQNGVIGIQIQIQKGVQDFKGVLTVTFNRRDGVLSKPLITNKVLEWNEWHYIAASYDYNSGIVRVYHNGNMVGEHQNGCMEIASHLPVQIGSLDLPNNEKSTFYGRVSSLYFFPEAISLEQIRAIAGIPEEDVIEAEEKVLDEAEGEKFATDKPQHNIVFEADAMEELRKLDVDIDEVLHFGGRQRHNPQPYQDITSYTTCDNSNQGEWQMQCPKFVGTRVKQVLKKEMEKTDMMTEDEANKVTEVWKLSRQDKWRLYRYWIEILCEICRKQARSIYPKFEECAERIKALHRQEDLTILRRVTIIGMTTTGAAKFRELIQEIQPRITIVEEAAEVFESHIVTSLSPGCKHLILIGDHQQLRPNPNVYKLAKDYKLDVSLFERMVNNGMDYQTLRKQHRMRPEIARMMKPIYEDLENHESVLNFENIKGVNKNIFFVEHNELEDFVNEGKSRSNIHEAKYLAALCRYFILQGYEQTQLTILTMYVGQLFQLKNETSDEIFQDVRICAVDNFQGEENDIILLSLVRSNEEGNIGFLRISNRVCVALSRARKGFYCIGNLELMCTKEKLWATIIEDMRERGNVGHSLTLMCQNHPCTQIHASSATDFQRAPQGGCPLPCHARLDCGHACRLSCHPRDPDHIEYECLEPCTKTLCDLGHKCKKRCFEECGPCRIRREKIMPACNHTQNLPCYVDPGKTKCRFPCEILKCGHRCSGNCYQCEQGRFHLQCKQKCDRTLACGHKCRNMCARKCPPCSRDCENGCVHKKCRNKCCEPCEPCMMPCAWICEHFECSKRCSEPCNRPRCYEPCKKTLVPCGHQCIGICGEPCPKTCRVCHKEEVTKVVLGDDPNAKFVELQPCGHVIEVNFMDAKMDECCNDIPISIQLKGCPVCTMPIRTCPRYSHIIKNTLEDISKVKTAITVRDYDIAEETIKIKSLIAFSDKFVKNSLFIREKLEKKKITMESLEMYQNQIILLNLLSKMLKEISHMEKNSRTSDGQQELKTSLEKEVTALKDRGINLTRRSLDWGSASEISDQEQEYLRDEILRVQLIVSYKILKKLIKEKEDTLNDADKNDMDNIGQTIDSGKRIEAEKLDSHMEILERIRSSYSILMSYQEKAITREDTMKIMSSKIGFTEGNWFKCLNGHIYSTADRCPKCI